MRMSKRHHRWTLSVAATTAAVAALATATPAYAATGDRPNTPGVFKGSQYVALGSSFAAGPGILPLVDVGCARSANNYPHLIATKLSLNLVDVSCSGATVDNILSVQQTAGGVKRPVQIDAVDGNTALVTVTVGGNDANYALNMFRKSCQTSAAAIDAVPGVPAAVKGALCGTVDEVASHKQMTAVEDKIRNMVTQIKARAPKAKVVLVDYQTVLPTSGATCAATPLNAEQIAYFNRFAKSLALATRRAAAATGATVIPLSEVSKSHDICSADSWSTGWEFGNDFLSGGVLPYHPNAAGMAGAAELVVEGLTKK